MRTHLMESRRARFSQLWLVIERLSEDIVLLVSLLTKLCIYSSSDWEKRHGSKFIYWSCSSSPKQASFSWHKRLGREYEVSEVSEFSIALPSASTEGKTEPSTEDGISRFEPLIPGFEIEKMERDREDDSGVIW